MPGTPPQAVLLDLDGTVHARGASIPGAAAAVQALRARGLTLRFLTNTDSKRPAQIITELAGLGTEIHADELFTPVTAAVLLLSAVPQARLFGLISQELSQDFPALVSDAPYTHVLVGDCQDTLSYQLLDGAFRALRSGAELLALQRGRYFKRSDGDHIDTGAVVAALEYASGQQARVLGKPAADFFQLAARSAGADIARCLVVGDDATTDIAGGRAAGALTVQVRTGKYADQRAEGIPSDADYSLATVAELPELLQKLGAP
ncbi:MAG TPA: HAD hydrolase-like protein [Streptosporangiaceae bacterium]|nr:HAD hydrolase-like protein [Streptosporangiaceae bacterium]